MKRAAHLLLWFGLVGVAGAQGSRRSPEIPPDARARLHALTEAYATASAVPPHAAFVGSAWRSTYEYLAAKKAGLTSAAWVTASRGKSLAYAFQVQGDGLYVQIRLSRFPTTDNPGNGPASQYFDAVSAWTLTAVEGNTLTVREARLYSSSGWIDERSFACRFLEAEMSYLVCKQRSSGEDFDFWYFLSPVEQ